MYVLLSAFSAMSATDTFVCRLCGRDRPIPTDRNPISKEKFKDKILCHTGMNIEYFVILLLFYIVNKGN